LLNSNVEMMEKYYSKILKVVDKNLLAKRHFAVLHDKIEMLNGRPQKYGTQQARDANGELKLYRVIDKSRLNEFRNSMNLIPIVH